MPTYSQEVKPLEAEKERSENKLSHFRSSGNNQAQINRSGDSLYG